MTKIFVGGSRHVARLHGEVLQRLENIMAQGFTFLVGDANGVDKFVQRHCADKHYGNVIVFCAGKGCRNNLGGWETRHVEAGKKAKTYKYYMVKDIEMAKEADYGFMIWDAQSSGTLSNILELLERGKKTLLYIDPNDEFVTIHDTQGLEHILHFCSDNALKTFESRFDLFKRIQPKTSFQLPMFP